MNDVRALIGEVLTADAALGGLCSVHYEVVKDRTLEGPFCLFGSQGAGSEQWAGVGGLETEIWNVRGVSVRPSEAEAIDDRCRELLDGQDLGGSNVFCRRTGPVDFMDDVDGTIYHYRGSLYRVVMDRV